METSSKKQTEDYRPRENVNYQDRKWIFGSTVNELISLWVQKGINRNLLVNLKEKGKRRK